MEQSSESRLAWLALILIGFLAAALAVYRPAFRGEFVSDDVHYVNRNPYVTELSFSHVLQMALPFGEPAKMTHNYAPVPLWLFTLEWRLFGNSTTGYHVVNVVLHALASTLLVAVLSRFGAPFGWACAGGALFLLHPANVEAVAWISQAKTTAAMVFMLLALLLYRERPAAATAAFAVALLSKITAAVALPVAIITEWCLTGPSPRRRRGLRRPSPPPQWSWLVAWGLLIALVAFAQILAFEVGRVESAYDDPIARVRTIVGFVSRYLLMALTSYGVSSYHSPDPSASALDPWFIASLAVLAVGGWRLARVLRQRRLESAFWVWALASFVPVSQIFPFPYPMADRYLYFILPGLIGGALLAARDGLAGPASSPQGKQAATIAVGAGILLASLAFGFRSHARAGIWQDNVTLQADSASNYPNGIAASVLNAKRAAREGRGDEAVKYLRKAYERGYKRFPDLYSDTDLKPLTANEDFRRLVREMARDWIDRLSAAPDLSQTRLKLLAHAYFVVGDNAAAMRTFERALTVPGPITDEIREQLSQLRALMEAQGRPAAP